jgi:hypothetical protein
MTEIHLARFGNRNNQHSVLGHSGISLEVLKPLIWRTDAPPESSGLGLEVFVSVFRHSNSYVVQTTRADFEAPRPGMVITNAALVPVEFVSILDLPALWSALDEVDLPVETPLSIDDFIQSTADGEAHSHAPGAGAIASAVLRGQPVAWVGPGLVEAIGCVWLHLRPEDRVRLVVGAAAHPARLSIPTQLDSVLVIETVQSVVARWSAAAVVSASTAPPADAARDAMFGDDEGRSADLAKQLELDDLGGSAWRHLATATSLLDAVSEIDHESCRALLQLLGLLQPDLGRGRAVKERALRRLRDLAGEAKVGDIRGLRGLPWPALGSEHRTVVLNDWSAIVTGEPSRTGEVLDAIAMLGTADPDPFIEDLASSLAAVVDSSLVDRLAAAAMEGERGVHALTWLVGGIADVDEIDRAFAEAAQAARSQPAWVTSTAADYRMRRLHAASVNVNDAIAAWRGHVQMKPRFDDADDILARRTTDAGVVAAALALTDRKLTKRAAAAVLKDSKLLANRSVTNPRMRAVWFEAVGLGADPWDAVEPSEAVTPLLDLIVAGEYVDEVVLESLSRTTAADISGYPQRADVWAALPPAAVSGFRSATAASLARAYRRADAAPEPPLQPAMLDSDLLASIAQESPAQAVELVEGLATAQASNAVVVIRNARFDTATESAIAELVVARRWRSAADAIVALSPTRADLRRATQRVSTLYGPLDKLLRFFTGDVPVTPTVSRSDLKAAFVDVAAQLYPDGPKTDRLWERAGGHEADLVAARTGRLEWGQAVDACLAGRRGAPSLVDLVIMMIEDYPKSSQLRALKNAIENGTS